MRGRLVHGGLNRALVGPSLWKVLNDVISTCIHSFLVRLKRVSCTGMLVDSHGCYDGFSFATGIGSRFLLTLKTWYVAESILL